jgi:hypothetical protein
LSEIDAADTKGGDAAAIETTADITPATAADVALRRIEFTSAKLK